MTKTILKPLITLYDRMDSAWEKVAIKYNFNCTGCSDNCCTSLFFHHSFVEKTYFLEGFQTLAPNTQKKIIHRAKVYCQKTFQKDSQIKSLKIMCPVNEDGRCLLYAYRPMICRLHGLPHELSKPGFQPFLGTGCKPGNFNEASYIKFDRTPFYQQMAQIEMSFRQTSGLSGKIKQSIAQMLLSQ